MAETKEQSLSQYRSDGYVLVHKSHLTHQQKISVQDFGRILKAGQILEDPDIEWKLVPGLNGTMHRVHIDGPNKVTTEFYDPENPTRFL